MENTSSLHKCILSYCVVLICRALKDMSNSLQFGFGQFSRAFFLYFAKMVLLFFVGFFPSETEKCSAQGNWEEVVWVGKRGVSCEGVVG